MCDQINIMCIFPWIIFGLDVSYCQHQTPLYVTWVLPNFFYDLFTADKILNLCNLSICNEVEGRKVLVSKCHLSVDTIMYIFFCLNPVTVLYKNEVTVPLTLNIKVWEVILSVTYFVCWDECIGGLSFFSWKVDNFHLTSIKFCF